jgi:hypothetical protein
MTAMPPYPVVCQSQTCDQPARYKVAARWSDGTTVELKTYALSCKKCLAKWFENARDTQRTTRCVVGETLDPPQIFERIASGKLLARPELETSI